MHRRFTTAAVLLAAATCTILARPAASPVPPSPSTIAPSTLPVAAEHRYRMAARVRPLLLFWIGRDNVGGTRIVWRRGAEGSRGWELLVGSDPARAPRSVNRWGYVREEYAPDASTMIGVMKQSDEESLEQAKSRAERESAEGYAFKLIESQLRGRELTSTVKSGRFPRDFTYRHLDVLLGAFASPTVRVSPPRQMQLPAGVKPGFLAAVADLIHDTTTAYLAAGGRTPKRLAASYAYNGGLYDLSLEPRVVRNAEYAGRTYPTLVEGAFEERNRKDGAKEYFTVVWGVSGSVLEVPVFISYQPRWWFKAELVLDENEKF